MPNLVHCFILKFLIVIKFIGKSPPSYIRTNYGHGLLKESRTIEDALFKQRRSQLDIHFLTSCLNRNIIPTFLQFKMSNRFLQDSTVRRNTQKEMLRREINRHQRRSTFFQRISLEHINTFKQEVSFLDYIWISSKWNESIKKRLDKIKATHSRKLDKLQNRTNGKSTFSPNEVIFNLSSYELNNTEKQVLAKGLNFAMSPRSIKFTDIAVPMEKIARRLYNFSVQYPLTCLQANCGITWDCVKTTLKEIALNSVNFFRAPASNLTRDELNAIRNLQSNEDLIVTRPDKGNGVVIMNRNDYNRKLELILSDRSKFILIDYNDLYRQNLTIEENFRRKLKQISKELYDKTSPSGTYPGRLYGLPKIHKPNTPLRPILSAINTTNYSLAQYLVPHLKELTESELVVKDTFSFAREIRSNTMHQNTIMVSFDIENLFTNVPLDETIDIILESLFTHSSTKILDLTRGKFRDLLYLATKECFFLFNKRLYQQTDGVAMGNPLGPVIANTFLVHKEREWLSNCPENFKPLIYRRYVDDIFLIFNRREQIFEFLNYLNSQHPNIRFSCEIEEDCSIPFLGINVQRTDQGFLTSIYRKPTFTGLYTHVDSFVPNTYKTGLINILLHRAYMICSSFLLVHKEFEEIKKIIARNGFSLGYINSCIGRFLNKQLITKEEVQDTKETIYVKLPYTGRQSMYIRNKIGRIIKKAFPTIDLKICFTTLERIGSRFRVKDRIPNDIASKVIYQFNCSSCNATYLGKTRRHLTTRCCEHLGITPKLRKPSLSIPKSAVYDHKIETGHIPKLDNFKILDRANNQEDLDIKEALHIYRLKPILNVQQDMTTLRMFQ